MPSPHTLPPVGATWSRIESDFYVASSEGNFLGYVDGDGHGGFLAHDMRSQGKPDLDGRQRFTYPDLSKSICIDRATGKRVFPRLAKSQDRDSSQRTLRPRHVQCNEPHPRPMITP